MEEAPIYNITIFSGADYRIDLTLKGDDDDSLDLTNLTVESQLREYPEAYDYHNFTVSKSGDTFVLTMPKEETEQIPYTQGYYDVFITNTVTEIRSPLLSGKANIVSQVSR